MTARIERANVTIDGRLRCIGPASGALGWRDNLRNRVHFHSTHAKTAVAKLAESALELTRRNVFWLLRLDKAQGTSVWGDERRGGGVRSYACKEYMA